MALRLDGCDFGYARRRRILNDFSVSFDRGRTVLLGPNGAGKSTLLALLADAIRPQAGAATLEGVGSPTRRSERRAYRAKVAWLPQNLHPFPGLTVREHVAYAGWLKGLSRAEAWERSEAALEAVDLGSHAGHSAMKLSGGQTRRMGLAGALVHDAQAVLLDEPTAGLDPSQRTRFREILQRLSPEMIVVVSTHQTEDVHESYERVVLLVDGQTPFDGSVQDFIAGSNPHADIRDQVAAAYGQFVVAED